MRYPGGLTGIIIVDGPSASNGAAMEIVLRYHLNGNDAWSASGYTLQAFRETSS